MMNVIERVLVLDVLVARAQRQEATYHVSFKRDPDLSEDETLGMYMAALSALFQNMEEDLGYGCMMAYEGE